MFDGVHVGHQALLIQAAQAARSLSAQTVAFTFTDAPGKLLHLPVTSLSTPRQRADWLREAPPWPPGSTTPSASTGPAPPKL